MTTFEIKTQIGQVKCTANHILPPKGYVSLATPWRVFFYGSDNNVLDYITTMDGKCCLNHEVIHIIQMKELGLFKFLLLYVYSYFVLRIKHKMKHRVAYHNIPFEREAKLNYDNFDYVQSYWRDYDFYNIFKK